MFAVVEFSEDEGGLAVVKSSWLTPRKKNVFWPPIKDTKQFKKTLLCNKDPSKDSWLLYGISRIFYESDDYEKVCQKLKLAEVTSDLNSENEQNVCRRIKPKRIFESSDEEEESTKFERPPRTKFVPNQIGRWNLNILNQANNKHIKSPTSDVAAVLPEVLTPKTACCSTSFTPQSSSQNSSQSQVFQKILEKLIELEIQNKQILNILSKKDKANLSRIGSLPELPIELPCKSHEDISTLDEFLGDPDSNNLLCSYLASLGGDNVTTRTNRILRQVLCDSIAATYSFYGRKKSEFQKLKLAKAIISSVRIGIPQSTEKQIEDIIKVWLKHAPERLKKKKATTN